MTYAKHLPATSHSIRARGWDQPDIVLVTGDALVDHPSFPAYLLGRVLEAAGFRVGLISRPDPQRPETVATLGLPRLFFGVTAGALDSMVGNYTAQKRRRSDDPYAPGGEAGGRPDRALTVYCNLVRQAFGPAAFIVGGGLEASLRRFAHYDFWSDKVRRPLLMDSGAHVLVHGMGEGPIVEIARRLAALTSSAADRPSADEKITALRDVPGLVYRTPKVVPAPEGITLPSSEEVAADPVSHAKAHHLVERHRGSVVHQESGGMRVIANPPWPAPTPAELDHIFGLPFTRDVHPIHKADVPALRQVRFAVTTHRGCFGGCSFCAIGTHQGKTVTSRTPESVLDEVRRIVAHPEFRGTVTDLGGPTANMYGLGCTSNDPCDRPSCLWPDRCNRLAIGQQPFLELLTAARQIPGVKHLFVTTGIRTDLAALSDPLVAALAAHHTSGQMKVAPEHVSPHVLDAMRKPSIKGFERFLELFRRHTKDADKNQFVLPYLMAAHPGCTLNDMKRVRNFLQRHDLKVEQCQIFTPTPGTAATVMYATGLDPATLEPVFVERDPRKKEAQKQLILHHIQNPASRLRRKKADRPR
jgi:uncharacterized radical SAM protein YgiQ